MSVADPGNIDTAAGDWFTRRHGDEWTPEVQSQLEHWLSESPLHRVAYLRIEHAWERAERLKVLATGAAHSIPPPGQWARSPFFGFRGVRSSRRRRSWTQVTARTLAASLAAAACLIGVWVFVSRGPVYRTPVGGLEKLSLADGSTLTLNTDSKIRLEFSDQERRLQLLRGEAFFDVAKDPIRPFIVEAGSRHVVAVGTQFSVRREDDEGDIEVVVTEGVVRIDGAPGSARVLPAGTIAHANAASVLLQKTAAPAAQEALSWRQGVLVFHDLTLAQAAAEFNRYNARQIVVDDPAIAALTIAGSFRANNVEAFVRLLEKGYPVRAQVEGDRVLLTGR